MKSFIKNKFPKLFESLKGKAIKSGDKPVKDIFTQKYKNKEWGSVESVSGPGSLLESTVGLRGELPRLLKKYNIKTILDAACGDFNWLSACEIEIDKYTGVDIVEELISENIKKHKTPLRDFLALDITKDPLPVADLILCRDTFVHYSFENIFKAVKNFKKSGSKYLLTTSFTESNVNEDIFTGGWREINLTISPFNFPDPVDHISDTISGFENELKGKILGLWLLNEINI